MNSPADKTFAIICFTEESKVEVVPTSWLNENNTSVKWPTNYSLKTLLRMIKGCEKPEDDWLNTSVSVLGFSKTFSSANRLADEALEESNSDSDYSMPEVQEVSRKRKKPIRFCSSDEEWEISKEPKNKKKFKGPNPTTLKTSLISGKNLSQPFSDVDEKPMFPTSSPIREKNLPQPSPRVDEKTMIAMLNRIFECLESIQKDLKVLKADQKKLQVQVSAISKLDKPLNNIFVLPNGVTVPVENEEQLMLLDSHLRDQKATAALAHYLHGCSEGKTVSAFMLNVTRKILSRTVAQQYSRLGRKGKKSFESVKEVYSAILAATALKFENAGREDLLEKFSRVLASSCDWEGARTKKTKDSAAEE